MKKRAKPPDPRPYLCKVTPHKNGRPILNLERFVDKPYKK